MGKFNIKTGHNSLKRLIALLLTGVIVFACLSMQLEVEGSYETNFGWNKKEEDLNEWPLEGNWVKTNAGIGTRNATLSVAQC